MSEVILIQKLEDCYDELKKYFPFTRNINRLDIIGNIKSRLLNSKTKTFSVLTKEDRQYMMIRELFIHKQLYDNKKFKTNVLSDKFVEISEDKLKEVFSEENFSKLIYDKEANIWCQYCANREICMAYYEKLDS